MTGENILNSPAKNPLSPAKNLHRSGEKFSSTQTSLSGVAIFADQVLDRFQVWKNRVGVGSSYSSQAFLTRDDDLSVSRVARGLGRVFGVWDWVWGRTS